MNANDIVAIALLFVAVTDTVLAQTLLPKILEQSVLHTPGQRKKIIRLVNMATLFCFAGAIFVYLVRPL